MPRPWLAAAVFIFCTGFMLVLVGLSAMNAPGVEYRTLPKPTPSEQTTFTVLGECDKMGCQPVVNLKQP